MAIRLLAAAMLAEKIVFSLRRSRCFVEDGVARWFHEMAGSGNFTLIASKAMRNA